ncbi:hypothetical protein [Rhodovibrio sodomensis]|nr:hypothetical protein [Rhodovibrio sodomensis]
MPITVPQVLATLPSVPANPRAPRTGTIHIHDSTLAVWEEGPVSPGPGSDSEKQVIERVMRPLCRKLASLGWHVGVDPEIRKNYPCLSRSRRAGRKGDLQLKIEATPRKLSVTLFQDVANVENRHGGYYDFDKLERMPYLLRLQALSTIRALVGFLQARHGYALKPEAPTTRDVREGRVSADAFVAHDYATNWHTDPALGRPRLANPTDNRGADGSEIAQGQTVWYPDRHGRWQRARAFYALNNMWWLSANARHITKRACFELHTTPPADPRRKAIIREVRNAQERALNRAVRAMDFTRAEAIRKHIFGTEQLYRIWSRKRGAWYGPNCSGYYGSANDAGLYRRAEAERATGRCDYLSAIPVAA